MAIHDLPSMIEYVLNSTGRTNLTYVGHSQGTTQMFAALTMNNDYYKQRLNGFIAFGPVTSLANIRSGFIKTLAEFRLDTLFYYLNFHEMLGTSASVEAFEDVVCKHFGILCSGLLELLSDVNEDNDDMDRFLVFIAHFPSGTSLKTLIHFADSYRHGRFAQLDGTPYNLDNIKDIPIGLFVGGNDRLATVDDNKNLKVFLDRNNDVKFYDVYDSMGHITYFISKDNCHLKDALDTMDTFNH